MFRRTMLLSAALLSTMAVAACEQSPRGRAATDPAVAVGGPTKAQTIDANVDASLVDLYRAVPQAKTLVDKANGVLVFPSITKAGFVVGGEYGQGALRVDGKTVGYYSLTSGSVGLTAGVQNASQVILFNTAEALEKFRNSSGWTAGVDASVALLKIGAGGTIDTRTANSPVQAIIYGTEGLIVDASIAGQKITRIDPDKQ